MWLGIEGSGFRVQVSCLHHLHLSLFHLFVLHALHLPFNIAKMFVNHPRRRVRQRKSNLAARRLVLRIEDLRVEGLGKSNLAANRLILRITEGWGLRVEG